MRKVFFLLTFGILLIILMAFPFTNSIVSSVKNKIQLHSVTKLFNSPSSANQFVLDVAQRTKFDIYNDGTHAKETTAGLNAALKYAHGKGYKVFYVPAGTYLIAKGLPIPNDPQAVDPNARINVPNDMTFWLDDKAIVKKESNSYNQYATLWVPETSKNVTIRGGTYEGDRDTHDYYNGAVKWQANHKYHLGDKVISTNTVQDSSKYYYQVKTLTSGISGKTEPNWSNGTTDSTDKTINIIVDNGVIWRRIARTTHESGDGVEIVGATNTTIDGIKTINFTGDGMDVGASGTYIDAINETDLESGNVDIKGNYIFDPSTIRTKKLTKFNFSNPAFKLRRNITLSLPSGMSNNVPFDFYFYRSDGSFISSVKNQIFFTSLTKIPQNAATYTVVFHTNMTTGVHMQIWDKALALNTFIKNSESANNRRQGITIGGADNVLVTQNSFHDIHGTAPQAGIDAEGGVMENGNVNEHLFIKNNHFYNNASYDLILYDGHDATVEGNTFASSNAITGNSEPFTGVLLKDNSFDNGTNYVANNDVTINGNNFKNGASAHIYGHNVTITGTVFTDAALVFDLSNRFGASASNVTMNYTGKNSAGLYIIGQPVHLSNFTLKGPSRGRTISASDDMESGSILDNFKVLDYNGNFQLDLPPGTFNSCDFETDTGNGTIGVNKAGTYVFNGCTFKTNKTNLAANNIGTDITIKNSNLTVIQTDSIIMFYQAKNVNLINNTLNAMNMTSTGKTLIQVGEYNSASQSASIFNATITGNHITSNKKEIGISTINAGPAARTFKIENNILKNTTLQLKSNDIKK